MFITPIIVVVAVLFFYLGWKAHGIFMKRPRWLFKGKKETEPGVNGAVKSKNGVMEIVSRPAGKAVDKLVETFMGGKPKNPKDDKEEP